MALQGPKEDYKYTQFLNLININSANFKKFGVALFGLGRAGTIHLKSLLENPRVELLYIIEDSAERRKGIQEALNLLNVTFISSDAIESVLDDGRVKMVVIATPTDYHTATVLSSLNKGKAVFCEKPIANDIKDVEKCYELASQLGLPLLSAFNRRFDPAFKNVQARVKDGELGAVHIVKTCSRDSPLPSLDFLKSSNGIIQDCAIHDIDIICWILNEFPTQVFASAVAHRPEIAAAGDHDTVAIHLTFPSGAMGIIDWSRYANYGYDQRLEVFGSGGMLLCGNQPCLGVQSFLPKGIEEPPIWYSFPSRFEASYKSEIEHFLNVLEGNEEINLKAKETLNVCRIVHACQESVKTGLPVNIAY